MCLNFKVVLAERLLTVVAFEGQKVDEEAIDV